MTDSFKKLYFRSRRFFLSKFPFSIERMQHTPNDFNESMRCQREFWKIIYVISGHGEKIINDRAYPMSAGSLFVIHPDDRTTFHIESESIDIYNIIFMPELISDRIKELKSDFGFFAIFENDFQSAPDYREMLYILDSSKETEQLIKKIDKEYRLEAPNYRNMIKLYLQALLINISRLSFRKVRKGNKKNVVQYIEHMINEHFIDQFNLDELAEQVSMTKSHLCRLFKAVNGGTIMGHLLERRLDEAERLLKFSDMTITEICYNCGFNNLGYFYRAFAGKYGIAPGKYRKTFTLY
jgi:AraC-like DNA-binding protein